MALISPRGCADLYARLLFANPEDRFSPAKVHFVPGAKTQNTDGHTIAKIQLTHLSLAFFYGTMANSVERLIRLCTISLQKVLLKCEYNGKMPPTTL